MKRCRWAATWCVGLVLIWAGQALAGADLAQTFLSAKKNGENLVEVVRLALQSGANINDVGAAAQAAGIGADIVTAAALAMGQAPADVAKAVQGATDTDLGYMAPAVAKMDVGDAGAAAAPEVLPGAVVDGSGTFTRGAHDPCPSDKICRYASSSWCCETACNNGTKCSDIHPQPTCQQSQ